MHAREKTSANHDRLKLHFTLLVKQPAKVVCLEFCNTEHNQQLINVQVVNHHHNHCLALHPPPPPPIPPLHSTCTAPVNTWLTPSSPAHRVLSTIALAHGASMNSVRE
eukprot:gene54-3450_t